MSSRNEDRVPAVDPSPAELEKVKALNIEIGEAERTKNVARLSELVDDRLVFRTAKPAMIHKADFLARFADPNLETRSLTTEVLHVTPLPNSGGAPQVLVECLVTLDRTAAGPDGAPVVGKPGPYWNVRIWEHGGQSWKMVAWFNHAAPRP